jgi:hypothetical protein
MALALVLERAAAGRAPVVVVHFDVTAATDATPDELQRAFAGWTEEAWRPARDARVDGKERMLVHGVSHTIVPSRDRNRRAVEV